MRLWNFVITGISGFPFTMLRGIGMSLWRNLDPNERQYNATCPGTTAEAELSVIHRQVVVHSNYYLSTWKPAQAFSDEGIQGVGKGSADRIFGFGIWPENYPGDVGLGQRCINVCWTMNDMCEAFLEFPPEIS